MKTLSIDISEWDFLKYNLQSDQLSFNELVDRIRADIAKETLRKAQEIAQNTRLSEMSLAKINAEIKAIRGAKDNS